MGKWWLTVFFRYPGGESILNIAVMRRALVLTDESARHPFLAGLPRHLRHGASKARLRRKLRRVGVGTQEVKDFLIAYCACFLAVTTFIA